MCGFCVVFLSRSRRLVSFLSFCVGAALTFEVSGRHFGSSRDPSTRLEFPLHLPSRQPHQDSFRVRFLLAVYIAWPLLLVALSLSVGNLVASDRVRSLWWNMDTKLGGSQLRAEPVGRLSRVRTPHCQTSSLSRVIRRKETTVGTSLLSRLDAARKCEGCQSGHFRNPVIVITFQPRPRRTTDHPLSFQICSLDAKHGVPQRC